VKRAALLLLAAATGCAPALREPPDVQVLSGSPLIENGPERVDGLLRDGDDLFGRRPDREAVRESESRFLEAAALDKTRVEGLIGAVRALSWRVEHEPSAAIRESLATRAVQTAQWCGIRAPEDARCDYWLAVALGLQARERPSTAKSGLEAMVGSLRRAVAADPALERGGPPRVLALVLLRAPGWPAGPGDPEEGLEQAERALAIDPAYPPNVSAWAEALYENGRKDEAREAWKRALASAEALAESGHPDAPDWVAEYRAFLPG
jgi:tetratricopeptide (TPR) repeat protein